MTSIVTSTLDSHLEPSHVQRHGHLSVSITALFSDHSHPRLTTTWTYHVHRTISFAFSSKTCRKDTNSCLSPAKVHQTELQVGALKSITNDRTQLTDAGHFTGVKGQLQVGLRPPGQPLLFLFHAHLIGLEALQLETGVFPQCSEAGERLFQYFTSVYANSNLGEKNNKKF